MREHRECAMPSAQGRTCHNAKDTNERLVMNLRELSHIMRFLYEGKGSQKRVLMILGEIDGIITQRELTERLGIQPGSASEVIAKLESAAYIRRTQSETDRRTVDIALTETGKATAEEAKEQHARRYDEMFSCLADDEKEQLLSLLEKVNADWETRYRDVGERRGACMHLHGKHGGRKKPVQTEDKR